ncbi:hypothetical protein D3C87_1791120 [compost metagenome]
MHAGQKADGLPPLVGHDAGQIDAQIPQRLMQGVQVAVLRQRRAQRNLVTLGQRASLETAEAAA